MFMRIVFIGTLALVLAAPTAGAQGKAQQVVLSKAVVKSMTANKTKSKTPLGARAGIVRKAGVEATNPDHATPTSVREIGTAPVKK